MKFSFGAEFKDTFVQYIYYVIYKTRRAVKEDEEENFLGETDAWGEGAKGDTVSRKRERTDGNGGVSFHRGDQLSRQRTILEVPVLETGRKGYAGSCSGVEDTRTPMTIRRLQESGDRERERESV